MRMLCTQQALPSVGSLPTVGAPGAWLTCGKVSVAWPWQMWRCHANLATSALLTPDIMGVCAEQNSVGMPVAVMDDDYSRETLALSEEIELYAGMDLYSSDRPKIVQVQPSTIHPENSGAHCIVSSAGPLQELAMWAGQVNIASSPVLGDAGGDVLWGRATCTKLPVTPLH